MKKIPLQNHNRKEKLQGFICFNVFKSPTVCSDDVKMKEVMVLLLFLLIFRLQDVLNNLKQKLAKQEKQYK